MGGADDSVGDRRGSAVMPGGTLPAITRTATVPASARRANRSPNLDALRAIAALMVIGAHASYLNNATRAPAGAYRHYLWSGVELFFILSGYLISRPFVAALLDHRELPHLGAYALRRAARILPAYWLVLVAALILTPAPGTTAGDVIAHVLLIQDSVPGQAYAIISVAWTLGLEAMFYVLVPLAAMLIARCCPRLTMRRLITIVVVAWCASMALAFLAQTFGRELIGVAGDLTVNDAGDGPPAVLSVSLPTTLYLFCPGILIAILDVRGVLTSLWSRIRWSGRRLAPVAVLLAFAVWSAGIFVDWDQSTPLTRLVRDGLFAVAFGGIVALALELPAFRARGVLWLAAVGSISYGLYLWHPLIEELLRTGKVGVPGTGDVAFLEAFVLLVASAMAPAAVSWFVMERRCIAWATARGRVLEAGHPPQAPAAAPPVEASSEASGDSDRGLGSGV